MLVPLPTKYLSVLTCLFFTLSLFAQSGSTDNSRWIPAEDGVFVLSMEKEGNFSAHAIQAFISKQDHLGSTDWLFTLASSLRLNVTNLTTTAVGDLIIAGSFRGDISLAGQRFSSVGSDDLFLAKVDASGNLSWFKQAGGLGEDLPSGLETDSHLAWLHGTNESLAFFDGTSTGSIHENFQAFIAAYDLLSGELKALYVQQPGIARSQSRLDATIRFQELQLEQKIQPDLLITEDDTEPVPPNNGPANGSGNTGGTSSTGGSGSTGSSSGSGSGGSGSGGSGSGG